MQVNSWDRDFKTTREDDLKKSTKSYLEEYEGDPLNRKPLKKKKKTSKNQSFIFCFNEFEYLRFL